MPINLLELEAAAEAVLPKMVFDYFAGGADDEISLRESRTAYERLRIVYRVLRDMSTRPLATTVLGNPVSMPVLIAPTAFHGLAHPEGEIATARAAGRAGTILILSTLSTRSIEEVIAATTAPVFFQLYVYRDRGATRALVERAEAAGCKALVLTVDAQLWGRRERDVRNRFVLPPGLKIKNLLGSEKDELPAVAQGSGLGAYVSSLFDPSLNWHDLEWLAGLTKLPILLKGLVHPEDARRALDHQVAGLIVSNHGGRQLDTAIAPIDALPAVIEAVEGKIEVLVDGGVRRGTDVVKALERGARAVALGRPILWGLALGGEDGVFGVLETLRKEVDLAIGLAGWQG